MNRGLACCCAVALACAFDWCRCSIACAADPVRIVLAIGQNVGSADHEPLRYAERDADRFAEVFTTLGDVAPERSYVVKNATVERV